MLTLFSNLCRKDFIKDSFIPSSKKALNWLLLNCEKKTKDSLSFLVSLYRVIGSPFFGGQCRFYPSCSEFALQALEEHRVSAAVGLIANRLCRCHPWGDSGYDPVPIKLREANGFTKK